MKKARLFLTEHQIEHQFIDYRVDGLTAEQLQTFAAHCGWQNLLNTRGTTYRQLPQSDKEDLTEQKALALMLAQPAMIKRPLLVHNGEHYLGFKPADYQHIFGLKT